MSINTNLMALKTANTLNGHYNRLAVSVQRLPSGLRVNSAADDAAGLAIRELMRADVAALQQGVRNANDAISLLQVADGALGIIDEKLIRMKELAEQAATGTYDSTQRLMIDSEFQAMGAEIDRIARATDFNGIKLLDGSRQGEHDGSGPDATGKLKIHFGSGNDSAEDYYYLEIADCTLAGLGLREADYGPDELQIISNAAHELWSARDTNRNITLNDAPLEGSGGVNMPESGIPVMQQLFTQGRWAFGTGPAGGGYSNFMFLIPQGTKNVVINITGGATRPSTNSYPDNDIQLFTTGGQHLAGTPMDDYVWHSDRFPGEKDKETTIDANQDRLPFTQAQYDGSMLNSGPASYDPAISLKYTSYNGMSIGYSGDSERVDAVPNNGMSETWAEYEVLTIDEAKEDLIVWLPGYISANIKVYWDVDDEIFGPPLQAEAPPDPVPGAEPEESISIRTQEYAQQALTRINDAIVRKDKTRAYLGAMQNRLENTITNLSIQGENLQAAESRISDTDVATEMTSFVRNQVLTQAAVAMLGQANTYPHMLINLLTG